MDDISRQHGVSGDVSRDSSKTDTDASDRPSRRRDRPLMPKSITEKMVERPVTTAAIFILLGALAAETMALMFARAKTRNALERAALRNLRLAQALDPRADPLSLGRSAALARRELAHDPLANDPLV